jgi:hypothetical protein
MSAVRRKLHAKPGDSSDSSAEAFVWASDRKSTPDNAHSPSYEQRKDLAYACSSPNQPSSKGYSAREPAVVSEGFKWISDYLEEDQQEKQQQGTSGYMQDLLQNSTTGFRRL